MNASQFVGILLVCGVAADQGAFEVASIRVNGSMGKTGFLKPTPDGLMIENMAMRNCIAWAWNLPLYRISGAEGPAHFDIVAKANGLAPNEQIRLMLQSLLEERFHLVVHFEKKDIPVYALALAKGGPKMLHDPEAGHGSGVELESTDAAGGKHWAFHNVPLSALAGLFSATVLERPILDMTGFQGAFDYNFVEPPLTPPDEPLVDHLVGDVFPEVQRQLGIRVEARAAPTDILIIDRVDKTPTEN
jgi:uncharacterized protein (TIGR03435 family)